MPKENPRVPRDSPKKNHINMAPTAALSLILASTAAQIGCNTDTKPTGGGYSYSQPPIQRPQINTPNTTSAKNVEISPTKKAQTLEKLKMAFLVKKDPQTNQYKFVLSTEDFNEIRQYLLENYLTKKNTGMDIKLEQIEFLSNEDGVSGIDKNGFVHILIRNPNDASKTISEGEINIQTNQVNFRNKAGSMPSVYMNIQ